MKKIEHLFEQILEVRNTRFDGSLIELPPEILTEIEHVDIKELIVYGFTHYITTAVADFFLMISPFWLRLEFKDWLQVFEAIKGHSHPVAEYHMAVSAARYLGIDPKFPSTKNVEIIEMNFIDYKVHSGRPATFVGHAQGRNRQMIEQRLQQVGLSIEYLIKYNERIIKSIPEENKVGKPEIKKIQ